MPPGSTVTEVIGRFPSIDISPVVEGGRYPVKAVTGETFPVSVTAFREGHDAMSVEVQFVAPGVDAAGVTIRSSFALNGGMGSAVPCVRVCPNSPAKPPTVSTTTW